MPEADIWGTGRKHLASKPQGNPSKENINPQVSFTEPCSRTPGASRASRESWEPREACDSREHRDSRPRDAWDVREGREAQLLERERAVSAWEQHFADLRREQEERQQDLDVLEMRLHEQEQDLHERETALAERQRQQDDSERRLAARSAEVEAAAEATRNCEAKERALEATEQQLGERAGRLAVREGRLAEDESALLVRERALFEAREALAAAEKRLAAREAQLLERETLASEAEAAAARAAAEAAKAQRAVFQELEERRRALDEREGRQAASLAASRATSQAPPAPSVPSLSSSSMPALHRALPASDQPSGGAMEEASTEATSAAASGLQRQRRSSLFAKAPPATPAVSRVAGSNMEVTPCNAGDCAVPSAASAVANSSPKHSSAVPVAPKVPGAGIRATLLATGLAATPAQPSRGSRSTPALVGAPGFTPAATKSRQSSTVAISRPAPVTATSNSSATPAAVAVVTPLRVSSATLAPTEVADVPLPAMSTSGNLGHPVATTAVMGRRLTRTAGDGRLAPALHEAGLAGASGPSGVTPGPCAFGGPPTASTTPVGSRQGVSSTATVAPLAAPRPSVVAARDLWPEEPEKQKAAKPERQEKPEKLEKQEGPRSSTSSTGSTASAGSTGSGVSTGSGGSAGSGTSTCTGAAGHQGNSLPSRRLPGSRCGEPAGLAEPPPPQAHCTASVPADAAASIAPQEAAQAPPLRRAPDGSATVEFVDADGARVAFRLSRSGSVDYYVNGRREVCNVDCYASGLTLHLREATPQGTWTSATRSTARVTAPSIRGDAIVQQVLALFQAQVKEAAVHLSDAPTDEDSVDSAAGLEVLQVVPRAALNGGPPGGQQPVRQEVCREDSLSSPGALFLDAESSEKVVGTAVNHSMVPVVPARFAVLDQTPGRHVLLPRSLADSFSQISVTGPPMSDSLEEERKVCCPGTSDTGLAQVLAKGDAGLRRKRVVVSSKRSQAQNHPTAEAALGTSGGVTPAPKALAKVPGLVPEEQGRRSDGGEAEESGSTSLWAAGLAARLTAPIASALRRVSR